MFSISIFSIKQKYYVNQSMDYQYEKDNRRCGSLKQATTQEPIMTQPSRVFLYAEFQVSVPFSEGVWREANPAMHTVPGLRSKTWLSGINTHSVGGFYEFDSVQNAQDYAVGMLADFAKAAGASLTVKLFDGDVVAEASKGMASPYYAT
jgi:hypothetical protein